MLVVPSSNRNAWESFWNQPYPWNETDFKTLIDSEPPGVAFFETEVFINRLYRTAQLFGSEPSVIRERARWVVNNCRYIITNLANHQPSVYLQILKWIKRSSCLSVVLGAGVSMGAGAPSWAALVQQLLQGALDHGHAITEMEKISDDASGTQKFRKKIISTLYLDEQNKNRALNILRVIKEGNAGTDLLMEGAQICSNLYGQHLFTHLTQLLYRNERQPGPTHFAIARLAKPQYVKERGGTYMGWASIITYNFDDLMGEALDKENWPRCSFAMDGNEMAGDPNRLAQQNGIDGLYQKIYHLHGYTPRRHFLITKVKFVFSMKQYKETYRTDRPHIFSHIFSEWLANPIFYSLYTGCSFADEAMNEILKAANELLPGRYHYAFLKWEGKTPFKDAAPEEIESASEKYDSFGVRPIWIEKHEDIPGFIQSLNE